jgi:hypothetical protein
MVRSGGLVMAGKISKIVGLLQQEHQDTVGFIKFSMWFCYVLYCVYVVQKKGISIMLCSGFTPRRKSSA